MERVRSSDVIGRRFPLMYRGYHGGQVDEFFERVVDALISWERGTAPGMTAADVNAHTFSSRLIGYSLGAVDDLMDAVAETFAEYERSGT